jgi:hypothetical protein
MEEDRRLRVQELPPAKDQKEYAIRMLSLEPKPEPRNPFDL